MADGGLGAHLPPALAGKLAKVLGMLGSDHDGEIAAAGRQANAMVRKAGLTWGDVIAPAATASNASYRPPRRWRTPATPSDAAALCLMWGDVLTGWEADFCRSMVGRHRISAKQTAVLTRIATKVEAFASATGEWS